MTSRECDSSDIFMNPNESRSSYATRQMNCANHTKRMPSARKPMKSTVTQPTSNHPDDWLCHAFNTPFNTL